MIVATTSDDVQFYSNDGQLFSDGEVTIYSPASLPQDSVLTSNNLSVCINKDRRGVIMVRATDADCGFVFWAGSVLSVIEASDEALRLLDQFSAPGVS